MSETNRFKTTAKNVGVKQKLSKFIVNNSDQSIAVDKIVSLAYKWKIIISKDLDQYERGCKCSRSRMFGVYLFKLITILTAIRYFVSSVFNTKSSVIFWSLLFFIFLLQLFSLVSMGFVACYLSILYLKYKFSEVTEKIELSLKLKNRLILITEHNSIAKQTKDLNELFSLIIFNIYFLATPPLMILIYLTHANDSTLFLRMVAIFVFIIVFFVVFSINLLSSLISQSAHKSRPLLHSFLIKNKVTTAQRFKIMAFNEKLSGPDIGFYCWNLFPMNNNQFYEYVANCVTTYFLILELI